MKRLFLVSIALLLIMTLPMAVHTLIADETITDWLPPLEIDWSGELLNASGNNIAPPIPNIYNVLWSVGGPPPALGFTISTERFYSGYPLPPIIVGDTVIVMDAEYIATLDLYTGSLKWGLAVYSDTPDLWYAIYALGLGEFIVSAAADNTSLYIATTGGYILALDIENGGVRWISRLEADSTYSNVAVDNGLIVVGTLFYNHTVYGLSTSTGEILWSRVLDTEYNIQGVSIHGDYVYVTVASDLYTLDRYDGSIISRSTPDQSSLSIPVYNNGYIYLTTGVGNLVIVDPLTGEIVLKKNVACSDRIPPIIYQDKVLIVGALGEIKAIMALNKDTLEEIWSYGDPEVAWYYSTAMVTQGTMPKLVVAGEGPGYAESILQAIYIDDGSLAWKQYFGANYTRLTISASRGKLIVAYIGEDRFTGGVICIGEEEPPVINSISHEPQEPGSLHNVKVVLNAYDDKSGIYRAVLSFSTDLMSWGHIYMDPSDGNYIAYIPRFPNGTTIFYKVTVIDNVGNWIESSTYSYTVIDRPPKVTIDSPSNGSTFDTFKIRITWSVEKGTYKIVSTRIRLDNLDWIDVTGMDSYTYEDIGSGDHTVTIEVTDEAGYSAVSRVSFTVIPTPPTITILGPRNGTVIQNNTVVLTWRVTKGSLDIKYVRLKIGKGSWIDVTGRNSYTMKIDEEGEYSIYIEVSDIDGNTDTASIRFTVKPPSPAISPIIIAGIAISAIAVVAAAILYLRRS